MRACSGEEADKHTNGITAPQRAVSLFPACAEAQDAQAGQGSGAQSQGYQQISMMVPLRSVETMLVGEKDNTGNDKHSSVIEEGLVKEDSCDS